MKNVNLLALINLFSGIGISLSSPFFPSLNSKFILPDVILGWILSAYSLSSTLFNSLVPFLIKKFSHINLLYFAAFFEASCTLFYGFLIYFPSYKIFLITMFILRIIHGCCSAMIGVVVYSLAASFSEEENTKVNITSMEIGWSLGKVVGPIIGAICFKFGGYIAPFIFIGISSYTSIFLVKNIKINFEIGDNEENEVNINDEISKILFKAEAWIILIGFVIGIIIDLYFYPCLTYHLINNYNISISLASLFFTVPVIVYMISAYILNNYPNRFGTYFTYTFGLICTALEPLFLYPVTPLPKNILFVILGLILIGIGQAPIFVQGLVLLLNIIKKISPNKDEISLNDIASTLNNIAIDIGGFCGPIIGGFITTKYNFNICCFTMFLVAFIYLIVFIIFFWNNIKNDDFDDKDKDDIKFIINKNEQEKLIENKNEDI